MRNMDRIKVSDEIEKKAIRIRKQSNVDAFVILHLASVEIVADVLVAKQRLCMRC